uniref:Uncharacterized protein n=1 Tax=Daucus carota subsp. sativus TaxID=79200 RepID=A0A166HBC1_DAUCS
MRKRHCDGYGRRWNSGHHQLAPPPGIDMLTWYYTPLCYDDLTEINLQYHNNI